MSDGMNYAPVATQQAAVCQPGEFVFGVTALDHGHIYGMTQNLKRAGATCKLVYDPDPKKLAYFLKQNPEARAASSLDEILDDTDISLVAAAAIPNLRAGLGIECMHRGKDYFTDKTPFTSLSQLDEAREAVAATGRKYACCYSERLQNEAAEHAAALVASGVIGQVIQLIGLGPHRLSAGSRPDWFFRKQEYGGIICDIGSHQMEQFLTYTGATDADVSMARVHNYAHPAHPELEDFGECSLVGNNGASGYFRMDWFTPDGLRNWGDGRTVILGTAGYIELRKYVDIGREPMSENNLYIVTNDGEEHLNVTGKVGFPFFGKFILDCLERTEHAMTQAHTFKAAELCLRAQVLADERN
ncbi:MAG: Gfo/Idh/MocA family oxidoreductase [Pseudomonadales bacterium]|nr:Gfo/Idh/MocA family oxidoreductase [Pseudomonadales bacterium]